MSRCEAKRRLRHRLPRPQPRERASRAGLGADLTGPRNSRLGNEYGDHPGRRSPGAREGGRGRGLGAARPAGSPGLPVTEPGRGLRGRLRKSRARIAAAQCAAGHRHPLGTTGAEGAAAAAAARTLVAGAKFPPQPETLGAGNRSAVQLTAEQVPVQVGRSGSPPNGPGTRRGRARRRAPIAPDRRTPRRGSRRFPRSFRAPRAGGEFEAAREANSANARRAPASSIRGASRARRSQRLAPGGTARAVFPSAYHRMARVDRLHDSRPTPASGSRQRSGRVSISHPTPRRNHPPARLRHPAPGRSAGPGDELLRPRGHRRTAAVPVAPPGVPRAGRGDPPGAGLHASRSRRLLRHVGHGAGRPGGCRPVVVCGRHRAARLCLRRSGGGRAGRRSEHDNRGGLGPLEPDLPAPQPAGLDPKNLPRLRREQHHRNFLELELRQRIQHLHASLRHRRRSHELQRRRAAEHPAHLAAGGRGLRALRRRRHHGRSRGRGPAQDLLDGCRLWPARLHRR